MNQTHRRKHSFIVLLVFIFLSAVLMPVQQVISSPAAGVDLPLESLIANPQEITLETNQSTTIKLIASYQGGTLSDVTASAAWTSDQPQIATVSGGTVYGLGMGSAQITAAYGGLTTTIRVTVNPLLVSLTPSPKQIEIAAGTSTAVKLEALFGDGSRRDVTALSSWSSDNAQIATVDSAGLVWGISKGSTKIRATYASKKIEISVKVNPPLLSVIPSVTTIDDLQTGQTLDVKLTAIFSDGTQKDVTSLAAWTSANSQVATVSAGAITGIDVGATQIVATYQGKSAVIPVTVTPAILALVPSQESLDLQAGRTETITLTAKYVNGTQKDVTSLATWTSSNPQYAEINAGQVTGIRIGSTILRASYGGKSITINVQILPPVSSLTIDPTQLELQTGKSKTLKLTAVYNDGTSKNVAAQARWTSDNPQIATVTGGTVTGSGVGTTFVTAVYQGLTQMIPVTVTPNVLELTATPNPLELQIGLSDTIHVMALYIDGSQKDVTSQTTWKSGDTKIASVENGLVSANNTGKTYIDATYGEKSLRIPVTVKPPLASLTPVPNIVELQTGKSQKIKLNAVYIDGSKSDAADQAVWVSDNPEIATVSKGVITGSGVGSVTITATYLGKTASVSVNVITNVLSLDATPNPLSIQIGRTDQIRLTATLVDGSKQEVTSEAAWSSLDAQIATVNGGEVNGIHVGTTQIKAVYGGKTLLIPLTVTPPLSSLVPTPGEVEMLTGKTVNIQLTATFNDGSQKEVSRLASWVSENPKVAAISERGTITGTNIGQTNVTATYLDKSVTIPVTVTANISSLQAIPGVLAVELGNEGNIQLQATLVDGSQLDVTRYATWKSENHQVVTVSEGRITAVGLGQTTVTAAYSGQSVTIDVTVTPPIASLQLSPNPVEMSINQSTQLSLRVVYNDGSEKDLTAQAHWRCDNETVATIDAQGVITAHQVGKALITATYQDHEISVPLTVTESLIELRALPASVKLEPNQTEKVTVSAVYADQTVKDVTEAALWSVEDTNIANADRGVIIAKNYGTTKVTVSYNGLTTTIPVRVASNLKSLTASPLSLTMKPGRTSTIRLTAVLADGKTKSVATDAEWNSSNPDVATVDQGLVKTLKGGYAKITANYKGYQVTVPVLVDKRTIKSISVGKQTRTMRVGDTQPIQLQALYSDGLRQDVTDQAIWTSSRPGVCDILPGQNAIRAYQPGKCWIYAYFGGQRASILVTVR